MNAEGRGLLVFGCVIGALVWFLWLDDSKLRYEIQHQAEVTIDDKPHDCEFFTAPLGRKNCSYQKKISIVLYSRGAGDGSPIISYDEGETWRFNYGGPTEGARVNIHWVRTDD